MLIWSPLPLYKGKIKEDGNIKFQSFIVQLEATEIVQAAGYVKKDAESYIW